MNTKVRNFIIVLVLMIISINCITIVIEIRMFNMMYLELEHYRYNRSKPTVQT